MEKAIIIDLDGTLSDSTHRQHFMTQPKKDWKSFYVALKDDPPHKWCVVLLHLFHLCGYSIILVTGRPWEPQIQVDTEQWLKRNEIEYENLFAREAGDFRPDHVIKKEIYENKIKPHYDVLFCVDDRKQVTKMWREIGLTCLQCADGDF